MVQTMWVPEAQHGSVPRHWPVLEGHKLSNNVVRKAPGPCDPSRNEALASGWTGSVLPHLSGIPVLRYSSILVSILANEDFWVIFPEQASTATTKYPT